MAQAEFPPRSAFDRYRPQDHAQPTSRSMRNSDNVADVAPYSGMSIAYYATPQAQRDGVSRNFGIVIDGNNGTAE